MFYVQGCDGSVLLNSPTKQAEKDSPPNLSLRGFQSIDRVKSALEKACPGVVSCADILALVAKDVVVAVSNIFNSTLISYDQFLEKNHLTEFLIDYNLLCQLEGPSWEVETGRRDGRISNFTEALLNLIPPFANISQLISGFQKRGLSVKDLVVLSGTA